jgi:hypothetical protein
LYKKNVKLSNPIYRNVTLLYNKAHFEQLSK